MLIRCVMSGMSVLAGLPASVETFPVWWAFPTAEYYARYDSPDAYGGRSCSQFCAACLTPGPHRCPGSSIDPCPGFPLCASRAVYHTSSFSTGRNVWGLPSS